MSKNKIYHVSDILEKICDSDEGIMISVINNGNS